MKQDMQKKADLAFSEMEDRIMKLIRQDPEAAAQLRTILQEAKDRMMQDDCFDHWLTQLDDGEEQQEREWHTNQEELFLEYVLREETAYRKDLKERFDQVARS